MTNADRGAFVSGLEKLVFAHDRGALANLRRGVGMRPADAANVYPYAYPLLPENVSERQAEAAVLVAALFALYYQGKTQIVRSERRGNNIGASLALLRAGRDSDSLEQRFVALLKCRKNELPMHLRHAVMLLRGGDAPIPINWALLFADVEFWDNPDRPVQQQWARGYWRFRRQDASPSAADEVE
ncbi:MAG: type I-E CRISPR-associated protein Cse2/CasB, partial [Chloroflexi bacterium]|nr:type I-E CRISPR-associated protein Cse2/CasB [Chloroflexota bacterium]